MGRCLHALLALASLVVACRGEDDQATRPLPAPEPSAQTQPSQLEPVSAPAEKPRERPKAKPEPEEPREEAASTPLPEAPIGAPSPTPSAPPPSSAVAPLPAVNAGCQQACQSSLQTCLAQVPADPDGGTNLDGLAVCKRSLDECKTKCSP